MFKKVLVVASLLTFFATQIYSKNPKEGEPTSASPAVSEVTVTFDIPDYMLKGNSGTLELEGLTIENLQSLTEISIDGGWSKPHHIVLYLNQRSNGKSTRILSGYILSDENSVRLSLASTAEAYALIGLTYRLNDKEFEKLRAKLHILPEYSAFESYINEGLKNDIDFLSVYKTSDKLAVEVYMIQSALKKAVKND